MNGDFTQLGPETSRVLEPSSCQHCGIPKGVHGQRWTQQVGYHKWQRPTQLTILVRMILRQGHPHRWLPQDSRTEYRKWKTK
jgi:hypothetical protein